ncbi:MAG: glycosyltransferase family A protein [bacterium]
MQDQPLVSVIMPVFNAEKYVKEAVESVLAQMHRHIEIICVNDASTDGSLEVLRSFGDAIRLIDSPENTGSGEARNKGVSLAGGDFIAFLDADDVWKPGKLAAQLDRFAANPALDLSFTHLQCFASPELSDEVKKLRYCDPDPMPGRIAGTMLARASFFRKAGLFDPRWRVGEFIDWIAKAEEAGLVSEVIPEVFLMRRIHETNTGVTERASRADYLKIVRESLGRKKEK